MNKIITLNNFDLDEKIKERNVYIENLRQKENKKKSALKIVSFLVSFIFLLSCSIMGSFCLKTIDLNNAVKEKVLRLHILANSNLKEDQELKIKVRDRVLSVITPLFKNIKSKAEAQDMFNKNKDLIIKSAIDEIKENNKDYSVDIKIGSSFFPRKEYMGFTLPKGRYDAIKINIGSASGKNWWCVAFPSLCFGSSIKENQEKISENLNVSEAKLLTSGNIPKVKAKFKIIEIFESIKENFN